MCKLLSAWRPEKIAPKLLLAKGMEITLFAFQGFRNLRERSEIYKDTLASEASGLPCANA